VKDLKALNVFLIKYRYRLLLGLLFVTLSNIFAIYPAKLISESFDLLKNQLNEVQHVSRGQGLYLKNQILKQVAWYGALILALAVLKGVFMFLMRQTIIVTSRLIEGDLKNKIYNHYQKLDISFYVVNRTGDLMARISEDVSRVRMYLGPAIMYIINLAGTFTLVIITMIKVNPKLTALTLAPIPFLYLFIYRVSSLINKKSEKLQQHLSETSSFSQESYSGIRVLKAFSLENLWQQKFQTISENYRLQAMNLNKTDSVLTPVVAGAVSLSIIIVIYFGGKLVNTGEITAGNIAEFIVYINLLIWPITSMGWISSSIQRAAASQKRINEFLNTSSNLISGNIIPPKNFDIEFKNVSFTYPETGIEALKNISLQIKAGQTIGIIGKTGSGKSTLASLLLRFYDPSNGTILINSNSLNQLQIGEYRNKCGWVPQEAFLFSDTIVNNLLFGSNNASEKSVEDACKIAQVWDNIQSFPNKLSTVVGERGITLSGGQKQRITIARALLKKPHLLILDDCLSAVDTDTEAKILNSFKQIYHQQTTVLISHRIATVKEADVIFVLDNGQVVEQGNHHQLINEKGFYFRLNETKKS